MTKHYFSLYNHLQYSNKIRMYNVCTDNPIKPTEGGLLTIKLVYSCQTCLVLEEFWSSLRSAKQS